MNQAKRSLSCPILVTKLVISKGLDIRDRGRRRGEKREDAMIWMFPEIRSMVPKALCSQSWEVETWPNRDDLEVMRSGWVLGCSCVIVPHDATRDHTEVDTRCSSHPMVPPARQQTWTFQTQRQNKSLFFTKLCCLECLLIMMQREGDEGGRRQNPRSAALVHFERFREDQSQRSRHME